MIEFADFQKVEMKVAKVVGVEVHPNADKLYVVKLDLGTVRRRQLTATTHGICVTRSARHRRTFASLSVVIVDVISANLG